MWYRHIIDRGVIPDAILRSFVRYGLRKYSRNVGKLTDAQLIILLGGIKELAQIRGYTDVNYNVVSPSPDSSSKVSSSKVTILSTRFSFCNVFIQFSFKEINLF